MRFVFTLFMYDDMDFFLSIAHGIASNAKILKVDIYNQYIDFATTTPIKFFFLEISRAFDWEIYHNILIKIFYRFLLKSKQNQKNFFEIKKYKCISLYLLKCVYFLLFFFSISRKVGVKVKYGICIHHQPIFSSLKEKIDYL